MLLSKIDELFKKEINNPVFELYIPVFWQIIKDVHNACEGDMARKCVSIRSIYEGFAEPQRANFEGMFRVANSVIYNDPDRLWQVAHQLLGFCSDDSFNDFCASLISRGKEEYAKAVLEPEFLLKNNIYPKEDLCFEGFQYFHHDLD